MNEFTQHPEISNYGLECDMSLWAEFNKELLVRGWIKSSRDFRELPVPDCGAEVDYGTREERIFADMAIAELVEQGFVNSITYLKEV